MSVPALTLLITDAGLARFTAAQLGEGIDLALAEIGLTDTAFVMAPTLTALPGEFRRLASLSGTLVGNDIVHLVLRDEAAVTYGARGVGLFLDDGTLFAVYGQPDRFVEKSPASTMLLALDLAFPANGGAVVTFGNTDFLNPPATPDIAGVAAIATQPIVDAGTDDSRIVTPKTLAARLADLIAALLASVADTVADYVPLAQKGQANGVARLDANALVPVAELPLAGRVHPRMITLFFGFEAPPGWAICDGREVMMADGSGPITTPDLRGRVAIGVTDDYTLGRIIGAPSVTVDTSTDEAGTILHYTTHTGYAGGGTQTAVAAGNLGTPPSLEDNGHHHVVAIDVIQPSLALHYIMKL